MHSRLRILPFIVIGIIALLAIYAYSGFAQLMDTYSPISQQIIATGFYGLMGLSLGSLVIIFLAGNRLSKVLRNFLFAFVFIHLFSLLVFDVVVLLDDFRRLISFIIQSTGTGHAKSIISVGFIIAVFPAFLFLAGMLIGPYRYKVIETKVSINNLPSTLKGLKIVQISDIHSGSFYNKKAVERGVELILKQKADVIFFTGDLVNDDATEMDEYKSIFGKLEAPMGVFSILGNHDYGDYVQWPSQEAKAANLAALKKVHSDMGWKLLLNEHILLDKGGEKIGVIGVENWGKGFHQFGDLDKAYNGCEAPLKLLLSHDPTHWDEQVTKKYKDINLTFSGHTHGAQMGFEIGRFKWSPIQLRYKKWAGLYELNEQFMYINRGFGFLGYPGRLGIWPEISVIILE